MRSEDIISLAMEVTRAARSGRLKALFVSFAAAAILIVAGYMQPNSDGLGTHQQLGLPKCGWILAANIPCPTCGMTTAYSHAVRGEIPSAFFAQPMGLLLAILTMLIVFGGFFSLITGYSFTWLQYQFPPSKVFIVFVVLTLASWGLKILIHRDFI